MTAATTRSAIHNSTSKTVAQWDDEWAAYCRVEVSYSGAFSAERIRAALQSSAKVVGVGNYKGNVRNVTDLGAGRLSYEVRYCIGD